MEPGANLSTSQNDKDFNASENSFTPAPYFTYSTSPHATMPFVMPPHGFSAMLTSSSPASPVFFHPPPIHVTPRPSSPRSQGRAREVDSPSQIGAFDHPSLGGTPNLEKSKPHRPRKKKAANDELSMQVEGTATKKGKPPTAKGRILESEDDATTRQGACMWKDFWVEHLIHIRGGMNDDFNKPQKQGMDLWSKIATKLASLFTDCDKDSEACLKKWSRVYTSYKADKAHNAISRNDRKWYDIINEYMHGRAHVVCVSHDASLNEKEASINEDSGEPSTKQMESKSTEISTNTTRGRSNRALDDSIARMVESDKALDHLKDESTRRDALEMRRLDIFEAMHSTMAAFLEHAKRG